MKKILIYPIIFSSILLSDNLIDINIKKNCSQIIDKQTYKICYDYKVKGPRIVSYNLSGENVDKINLKKRPRFYTERLLPKKYRTNYADYTYTGYDRGHINSDASNDYSYKALNKVYSMANIVPQPPSLNRFGWAKLEKYEREMAIKYYNVDISNIIYYKDMSNILKKKSLEEVLKINNLTYIKKQRFIKNSKKLLKKKIVIPSGFLKIISNNKFKYLECFYYSNDKSLNFKESNVLDHKVECPAYPII